MLPKDPMAIERSNLLSMMKLSIKVLIQSSLSLGRTLDSAFPPLQQFFVVLEHCLKHGLKGEKRRDVYLWHWIIHLDEQSQIRHSSLTEHPRLVFSAKKSFIGQSKSIWGPLELVEKLCPESTNIATSARDLPSIK